MRSLERQGLSVVGVAVMSAEALSRAGELRPDLALVDVMLAEVLAICGPPSAARPLAGDTHRLPSRS